MRKSTKKRMYYSVIALALIAILGIAFAERGAENLPAVSAPTAPSTATPEPTSEPTPEPMPTPEPEPTRRVDPDRKMIALSFDDGPGAGTRRILNALDEVGGRATFCMVGNRVERYASTARKVAAQGSEIATHTWDHPNLAKLTDAQLRRELEKSLDVIERVTGVRPSVLRPPYGSVNGAVRSACRDLGLVIANWNIDPEDWRVRNARQVYRHIMDNARDGAIVLCHDLYEETAAAMESAIADLAEQGYQLVTVSELLAARTPALPGQIYYSAAGSAR